MDAPLWTDIVQAIGASVAVPGAIVAFIILFKKDKAKESEIASLSAIADQLTQMQVETEKRYKASKKPVIDISITHLQEQKKISIDFVNTNSGTTLKSYDQDIHMDRFTLLTSTINQQGTRQSFEIGLSYKTVPPEFFVFYVDYVTEEGYIFLQDITVWLEDGKYRFSPSAIIDKKNSLIKES